MIDHPFSLPITARSAATTLIGGLILLAFPMPTPAQAQWSQANGTIYYTGTVGINTTTPYGPFTVNTGANQDITFSNMDWLGLTGSVGLGAHNDANNQFIPLAFSGSPIVLAGNVGIGTSTPKTTLEVNGEIVADTVGAANLRMVCGNYGVFWRNDGANTTLMHTTSGTPYGGWNSDRQIMLPDNNDNVYLSLNGGHVGIGTGSPQYPLSVNGVIQAKEVIVNTGWSDYVFDRNYRVPSLEEVSDYVTREHHLPGIPSQSEVEKNGVSLGDVQSKMLAKLEELTLQVIQLNEKTKRLELENEQLRNRMSNKER